MHSEQVFEQNIDFDELRIVLFSPVSQYRIQMDLFLSMIIRPNSNQIQRRLGRKCPSNVKENGRNGDLYSFWWIKLHLIQSVSHSSHSNGQLRGLFLREIIYIHSDNNHKNVVNGPLLDCLYFLREREKERDLIYVLSLPEIIDFFYSKFNTKWTVLLSICVYCLLCWCFQKLSKEYFFPWALGWILLMHKSFSSFLFLSVDFRCRFWD